MKSVRQYQIPYLFRDNETSTLYIALLELEEELDLPPGWAFVETMLSGKLLFEKEVKESRSEERV